MRLMSAGMRGRNDALAVPLRAIGRAILKTMCVAAPCSRASHEDPCYRKERSDFKGKRLARPERLELPTLGFEDRYSIQLSYGRGSGRTP